MNADGIGKIANLLKDLSQTFLLVMVAALGCYLAWSQPHRQWFQAAIADLGIQEIKGIKFADALNKQQQARLSAGVTAKQDVPPVPEVETALAMLPNEGSFWVYLGNFKDGRSTSNPNFRLEQRPNKGDIIIASRDVFKRAGLPVEKNGNWYLAQIKGVVSTGHEIRVTAPVQGILDDDGSEDLWAEATDS
jgi:hypothetical protein